VRADGREHGGDGLGAELVATEAGALRVATRRDVVEGQDAGFDRCGERVSR
jgi:hypothetical protein